MSTPKHRSSSNQSPISYEINQRNRAGRTGLDPLDTAREYGLMEGLLLRKLFTGRLRTHSPFLLAMMLTAGLLLTCLLVGIVDAMAEKHRFFAEAICFVPMGIAGPAFLYNFAMSLVHKKKVKH